MKACLLYEKQRMDDIEKQNQAAHLCENDSAPASPKRSKPSTETSNDPFATEAGFENDRATQSCVFWAKRDEAPGDSYNSRCLSLSQSASQEREAHVENAIQESATFFRLKSGCAETNCTAEECPTQKHSPGLFVTVREETRLHPQATHQKPEISNQEGQYARGTPYQCYHQSNVGGTLEAGYTMNCKKNETPSANIFATQTNSPEYIPKPYMPSYEAEYGLTSFEITKNYCENEDVTRSGNAEDNDVVSRGDREPGRPGGAAQDRAFRTAAAPASFACAERAAGGRGPGNASRGPADVIDAAALIESRICREAGATGAERTERVAPGRRPGCSPHETGTGGVPEGDAKTAHETAREDRLVKDHDSLPEESARLAPSSEATPVISCIIYESDTLPSAQPHIDAEFMHSPQRDATIEPSDREFTWETGTEEGQTGFNIDVNIHTGPEPTEQRCLVREELDRRDHDRLRHEEDRCLNASCPSTAGNCCAKSQSRVRKPDAADYRCEVSNLVRPAPSNTERPIRTGDTVSPICVNTPVNTQAEERDSDVVVIKLPVGSAKAESEVEEAGSGDAVTGKGIWEGERGAPPPSLSPQTTLTHGCLPENTSVTHHSDATHSTGDERHLVIPVTQPGDAVVPETDAGYGADTLRVCPETGAQFPEQSDRSPAVFDSFEKIPLSLSADGLELSPLFDTAPHNSISGRPQSYYDADGPSSEIIPMQIQLQPSSDLNKNNKQRAGSERDVEHSPSGKVSALDCGSYVLTFGQGGSPGESLSPYLCGLREEKQIPRVCFSQRSPAIDPEQPDPLAAGFAASGPPECTADDFDECGRLETCPRPSLLRPPSSVLTLESSQNDGAPQFEMKEKFDLVLEELSSFFSIGKEAERPVSSETLYTREAPSEDGTTERPIGPLSSPSAKAQGRTRAGQNVHSSIRVVGQRPETTSGNVGFDCEQEVPLGLSHSSAEGEDSMYSAAKQKEYTVAEDGSKNWFPAFMALPFLNEQNRGVLEPARRLEPLKTCVRPIRVGLSKRERPKQLHPYSQ